MSRSAAHRRPRIRATLLVVALYTLGTLPAPAAGGEAAEVER